MELNKEAQYKLDIQMLKALKNFSATSTCIKRKVGAIIAKDDGALISVGYNKSIKGIKSCSVYFNEDKTMTELGCTELFPLGCYNHSDFHDKFEIHAEIVSILGITNKYLLLDGADIYISLQPCENCTKVILESGIKRIIFSEFLYAERTDKYYEWIEFMKRMGIEWKCIKGEKL